MDMEKIQEYLGGGLFFLGLILAMAGSLAALPVWVIMILIVSVRREFILKDTRRGHRLRPRFRLGLNKGPLS
jgi:hypothetical protein